MPSFLKPKFLPVVFLLLGALSFSQSPTQALQTAAKAASGSQSDPLNRTTPQGCVLGFLEAAQRGDNSIAAQYLQMSAAHRQAEGEQLAVKLKFVMDSAFAGSLKSVSTSPDGIPQEGVPLGRQRLGTMTSGDVEVDLDLVRVSDSSAGKIWLISSDTLARVPELYDQVEARQVEHKLPRVLVKHELDGMPLWQWLALLIAAPVVVGVGWIVLVVLEIPVHGWARRHGHPEIANWRSVSAPAWLVTATLIHQICAQYIGMPLLPRHHYYQATSVLLIIGATWILWRVVQWSMRQVRSRALARGHVGTGSLMLLGESVAKAAIFVLGALAVFGSLGFNLSTALAGVGIGGLAIGFGAQQTIANLFGGISVLGDEVIRVGDVCRFGDRTGTVEDIGWRSTRVRTEERTLLAIPNGTVATINVENLSRRDKILFKTNLGLRPETKADHLRFVLAEIRRLLYSHPKVESASVRVRLTEVAGSSHTAEAVCYILTRDYNEYAAVREDLLLRMMDIVEDAGSGFAVPTQTLYLSRDGGIEKEKADSAVQKIAAWRDEKKLPFPDFHEKDVSSFKGSIDYPPSGSALGDKSGHPGKSG